MRVTRRRERERSALCARRLRGTRRSLGLLAVCLLSLGAAPAARAASDPADMLTYMPTELVFSVRTPEQVDEYLGELGSYGLGQALLQMPRFKKRGTLKLRGAYKVMLPRWVERAAAYDRAHGASITVTAVFNAYLAKKRPLDLEDAATRANIVAAVESVLADGVGGVQLDIEPFADSPGLISLLGELRSAFSRLGFRGRLSVVAPADTATWPAAYVHEVSELADQVDPTFYESECPTAACYETWVKTGLAYYSANVSPHARIVPVIPSYRSNAWHNAGVENIATATAALEGALAMASRVNGAGIWWWYGFYYGEGGRYDPSADRAAWLSSTLSLPFSP